MHATATLNGRFERRTLNDSIGRLDSILDGLGEAIPETIRESIRSTVGPAIVEGVRAALLEMAKQPGFKAKPAPGGAVNALKRLLVRTRSAAVVITVRVRSIVLKLRMIGRCGRPMVLAAAVGAVTGFVCYSVSPWLSGMVGGVAGTVSALAIQSGLWLRRSIGRLMAV